LRRYLATSPELHFYCKEQRAQLTVDKNDLMEWPVRFPAEMSAGTTSVLAFDPADAVELFESLADERVWEHMSRDIPADAATLDEVIRSRLAGGYGETFTVRQRGRAVGITSVVFDPDHPAGAEVGGTVLITCGVILLTLLQALLLPSVMRFARLPVEPRLPRRSSSPTNTPSTFDRRPC
jgi:hypothetical protein